MLMCKAAYRSLAALRPPRVLIGVAAVIASNPILGILATRQGVPMETLAQDSESYPADTYVDGARICDPIFSAALRLNSADNDSRNGCRVHRGWSLVWTSAAGSRTEHHFHGLTHHDYSRGVHDLKLEHDQRNLSSNFTGDQLRR
jgi:hypothetical protein